MFKCTTAILRNYNGNFILKHTVESEDIAENEMVQDAQGGERVEVSKEDAKDDVEAEEYEDGIVVKDLGGAEGEKGGEKGVNIPLPDLEGGAKDKMQLAEEQKEDVSLKENRKWAENGEKGYTLENGLIIHTLVTPIEQICKRIVVPCSRRSELLKLAHSSMLAGHFSHGKTTELLNRRFSWPGMLESCVVSVFPAKRLVGQV